MKLEKEIKKDGETIALVVADQFFHPNKEKNLFKIKCLGLGNWEVIVPNHESAELVIKLIDEDVQNETFNFQAIYAFAFALNNGDKPSRERYIEIKKLADACIKNI